MITQSEVYRQWAMKQLDVIAAKKQELGVERLGQHTVPSATLAADTYCNPWGCKGWADPCGDNDIVSLSFAGASKLLDVLDWRPTSTCRHVYKYLTWVAGAEKSGSIICTTPTPTTPAGIIDNCCEDRPGIAYGTCEYEVNGFGFLGRQGGITCIYDEGMQQCDTQQLVRFNGQPIRSNFEWRAAMAGEVIMQDLLWMLIYGNSATAGQMDGLEKLIGTGVADYKGNLCPSLDSIVVTWNGGCYSTAPSTWEDGRSAACGAITIPTGASIIDLFKWITRNQDARIRMTGNLRSQGLRPGDRFLAVNSTVAQCLLDCMVCYRMCDSSTNIQVQINNRDSQEFRDSLLGGFFGDGQLKLDNGMLPLLVDDTIPDDTMYLMIPRVGNRRMIFGEYQDMNSVETGGFGDTFMVSDGGRFMHYNDRQNTCVNHTLDHRPRLQAPGRYLQAKIKGFDCSMPKVIPSSNILSQVFVNPTLDPALCP